MSRADRAFVRVREVALLKLSGTGPISEHPNLLEPQ